MASIVVIVSVTITDPFLSPASTVISEDVKFSIALKSLKPRVFLSMSF